MEFFNPFGLFFIILIMIPNIVFALKCKEAFENPWKSKIAKILEIFEQIGRYGCFAMMIFNIPGTYFGFFSDFAFAEPLVTFVCVSKMRRQNLSSSSVGSFVPRPEHHQSGNPCNRAHSVGIRRRTMYRGSSATVGGSL